MRCVDETSGGPVSTGALGHASILGWSGGMSAFVPGEELNGGRLTHGRAAEKPINCLVYMPQSYNGRGPAQSCVQIIRYFGDQGLRPTLFVGRARRAIPDTIEVRSALPAAANLIPWRLVSNLSKTRLDRAFARALETEEPGIAYFWPGHDRDLIDLANRKGWVTVREMTNRTMQAATISLDKAFELAGEHRPHHIDAQHVEDELEQLKSYDFVFSSNHEVDLSLLLAGVQPERILKTTFGWAQSRSAPRPELTRNGNSLVIGYLGMISIGKGVLDLIDAWKRWTGDGVLRVAGPVDWSMKQAVASLARQDARVELPGYVSDSRQFFSECDIVVIPTLDEGGPQVTFEAAAAGAAIIATPMAKARMLENERNALIVPCHDPDTILAALGRLAGDSALRTRLGRRAQADAASFDYAHVGARRASLLVQQILAAPHRRFRAAHANHMVQRSPIHENCGEPLSPSSCASVPSSLQGVAARGRSLS